MERVLGAIFVISACGGFGFSLAAGYRREVKGFRQLMLAIKFMQCELQYRRTPLAKLCRMTVKEIEKPITDVFIHLAEELEQQVRPDVASCMHMALVRSSDLPKKVICIFTDLGNTLGRYDLQGQLEGLEMLWSLCNEHLTSMNENSRQRIRSYQTLGLCAGAALAILMI